MNETAYSMHEPPILFSENPYTRVCVFFVRTYNRTLLPTNQLLYMLPPSFRTSFVRSRLVYLTSLHAVRRVRGSFFPALFCSGTHIFHSDLSGR